LGDGWQRKRITPCKSWLESVVVYFLRHQLLSILLSLVVLAVVQMKAVVVVQVDIELMQVLRLHLEQH
jgi:hypothetical protein